MATTPNAPSVLEFQILMQFTVDITKHAAHELGLNIRSIENPGPNRRAYMQALLMGSELSPPAVKEVAKMFLATAKERVSADQKADFSKCLNQYYVSSVPMPDKYSKIKGMMQDIRSWEALSDIHQFHSCFRTKTLLKDDPRDIGMCIHAALKRHHIEKAYAETQFGEGTEPNEVMMILPIAQKKIPARRGSQKTPTP